MLTPENKRRLVFVGVFLVPVVLVKGTSMFYGIGAPAGASAAVQVTPDIDTQIIAAREHQWTPEQRKAAARVAELYDQPFKQTPLYYEPREMNTGNGPAQPIDPSLPNLVVQTILVSSGKATVLINNKVYRIGDMFEETAWKITNIDNDTRTVTLENQNTGKVVDAAVRTELEREPR